jgi:hypothetical protein
MDKEIDRKESHESKSILKFGEKRSNSVASLIPEENLFENLTKFGNDGFEPPIYQTDVKRFDTIGGGVQSKDSTDLNEEYGQLYATISALELSHIEA